MQWREHSSPPNVNRVRVSHVASYFMLFLASLWGLLSGLKVLLFNFFPPWKPALLHCNSIWKQWTKSTSLRCVTANPSYLLIYLLSYLKCRPSRSKINYHRIANHFNTCACNATPVLEEICQDSTADNFANIFKSCLNIPVTNYVIRNIKVFFPSSQIARWYWSCYPWL